MRPNRVVAGRVEKIEAEAIIGTSKPMAAKSVGKAYVPPPGATPNSTDPSSPYFEKRQGDPALQQQMKEQQQAVSAASSAGGGVRWQVLLLEGSRRRPRTS